MYLNKWVLIKIESSKYWYSTTNWQVTMVLLILQSGTKVDTKDIIILSIGVPVTIVCFALGYLSVRLLLLLSKFLLMYLITRGWGLYCIVCKNGLKADNIFNRFDGKTNG